MVLNMDCAGLVFDTTCLSHFAIADRVDVLGDLVNGLPCHSTSVVFEEIRRGAARHSQLETILEQEWLSVRRIDESIDRLTAFVEWTNRIGTRADRDLGEASVLALAVELGSTAVVDDLAAKSVALRHYPKVHGTLWLLAEAWRVGRATEVQACNLVNSLIDSGMRLPCTSSDFPDFVKGNRMGPWSRR